MEPKFDSLVCDRLIPTRADISGPPGWGLPGWGPVPLCVLVVVRRSPGLCGVAMRAATRCACPRSRPRRPACHEVPSSTGTGRADSGYRRETTNDRRVMTPQSCTNQTTHKDPRAAYSASREIHSLLDLLECPPTHSRSRNHRQRSRPHPPAERAVCPPQLPHDLQRRLSFSLASEHT